MKLYTVWSGEYSDRGMHAIFQSKEKAEKYRDVHSKLCEFEDFYIVEYELEDDKFDINTEAHKFYYCTIALKDHYYLDGSIAEHKGEITTDDLWDGFMDELNIEKYEDLNPKEYAKQLNNVDVFEDEYGLPIEWQADNRQSYIHISKYCNEQEPTEVYAYSQLGYHHARKIALDKYYEFIAQEEGIV